MLLKEKIVVLTGANRGIGHAILRLFLEEGATVLALGRTPPELTNFEFGDSSSLSERLKFFEVDLSDTASVKQAVKNVKALKLNITTLINNAGYIHTGMLQMTSSAEFEKQMLINFHSPMTLIKDFSKGMLKRRAGSIINIASSAAIDGNEGRSGYAASKAALIAATKVLARESGPRNVRANCIAPGLTDTKLMRESTSKDAIEEVEARLALRRIGEPEEIAKVALFLASDLSTYVTGQVIRADGGM